MVVKVFISYSTPTSVIVVALPFALRKNFFVADNDNNIIMFQKIVCEIPIGLF